MVLIAPAVDFTEELMWKRFPAAIKREIEQNGVWLRPSEYSEAPYPITRRLIEEGRAHLLLGGLIETGCPVHILQGAKDADVPWRHALELVARFARDDVVLTLIKDGDHRLSRPEDIERLIAAVKEFSYSCPGCGAARSAAEWCAADPGPRLLQETWVPGLQRITPQVGYIRLAALNWVARSRVYPTSGVLHCARDTSGKCRGPFVLYRSIAFGFFQRCKFVAPQQSAQRPQCRMDIKGRRCARWRYICHRCGCSDR